MLRKATRTASQSVLPTTHTKSATAFAKVNLQNLKFAAAPLGSMSQREFGSAKEMSEL
jgi:hypothetical protein